MTRTNTSTSDSTNEPRPQPGTSIQTLLPVVELPGAASKRCVSYGAGHNVHFIQARLATERPGTRGTLVRTEEGIVLRPVDGSDDLVLRCHRPEALEEVLELLGPHGWRVSTCLLLNDRGVGVSVADGEVELLPCVVAEASVEP